MLSLFILIIVTYVAFVFFGEGLNPLTKPRNPMIRSRWRYGRRMALAAVCGWTASVVLMHYVSMNMVGAVIIGFLVAFLLGVCFSMGKIVGAVRRISVRS